MCRKVRLSELMNYISGLLGRDVVDAHGHHVGVVGHVIINPRACVVRGLRIDQAEQRSRIVESWSVDRESGLIIMHSQTGRHTH